VNARALGQLVGDVDSDAIAFHRLDRRSRRRAVVPHALTIMPGANSRLTCSATRRNSFTPCSL